jgi:tripartite-type tricarboxylate transporter receptor subunit TctC
MQWHTSKVQSIADSQKFESSLAGTGPGSIAETVPRLLNALIGTKFKLVSGYPASNEAMLAMERGEVEGASSSWAAVSLAKKEWLRDKKIRIILQTAPERIRELPDAPALPEIGTTPEDKQVYLLYASGSAIGRSVIAPPELPADRTKALREAFNLMVKDPEFLADIAKLNVELDPLTGEAVQDLIVRTLNVPPAVRERAKLAFGR